jgi:hypothetical protein
MYEWPGVLLVVQKIVQVAWSDISKWPEWTSVRGRPEKSGAKVALQKVLAWGGIVSFNVSPRGSHGGAAAVSAGPGGG